MSAIVKLVDKLEGVEKFRAWKYRIGLILEENDLAIFTKKKYRNPSMLQKRKSIKRTQ
jgi:hypothetical protein